VDLFDLDSEDEVTYQIVGDGEASIEQGLISVSSPLARALINKQAGDVAEVDAPRGRREYEVVEIRYE
jgi:transcription elongation factor GreA